MELLGGVGHVESRFGPLGDSVGIGAPNLPYPQKLFWTHPMELLGDVGHVESPFGSFGDSDNLDSKSVHGLRETYRRLRNHFGRTRWNS
jgi:hypothetical protein